jgi:hypothetical protein
LEAKTEKLLEIERVKLEQQLDNEKLLESERQLLREQSEEAINEILANADQQKLGQAQEALDQSLEDFSEYTQGLINEEKEKYLQGVISKEEYDKQIEDLELASLEVQKAIKEQFGQEDLALQGRITDYKIALGKKELEAKKAQEQAKLDAVKTTLATVAGALNKQSVAYKAIASTLTIINTIESAIAAFKSMAVIPIVGPILGAIAAAAATASGLAAVAKINSTQVPKMAEGGMMELQGPAHSAGGMDVHVGNKKVANVEGGEKLVVLKRGVNPGLLRNLSTINALVGGRDFYQDRTPRYRNQDGGFIARSASVQAGSATQRQFTQNLASSTVVLQVSELHRVEQNMQKAEINSELR